MAKSSIGKEARTAKLETKVEPSFKANFIKLASERMGRTRSDAMYLLLKRGLYMWEQDGKILPHEYEEPGTKPAQKKVSLGESLKKRV